jgi:cyclic pyranopterin phosphate synthase
MDVLHDDLGRPLRSLRVSVTDRCNLRCAYCMPEQGYRWLERERLLHFGEIATLVDAFCSLGLEAVRITGGEPLMRRELPRLVEQLARRPALREIAMTTNGMLLAEHAEELALAGLRRVTVSLDTLDERTFERIARRRGLPDVLAGIAAATRLGPGRVKLDTVVLRDVNDAEVTGLLEFARERGIEARFIEYMDVGGATNWSPEKVVSRDEILRRIEHRHGPIEELRERSSAPAERFRLGDGTVFVVASTTTFLRPSTAPDATDTGTSLPARSTGRPKAPGPRARRAKACRRARPYADRARGTAARDAHARRLNGRMASPHRRTAHRSRAGGATTIARRRAWTLLAVHVAMVAHYVHWKLAGRTLAPLELNEAVYTAAEGVVTAGFVLLAVLVLASAAKFSCSLADCAPLPNGRLARAVRGSAARRGLHVRLAARIPGMARARRRASPALRRNGLVVVPHG